jgi:hypothetical protein
LAKADEKNLGPTLVKSRFFVGSVRARKIGDCLLFNASADYFQRRLTKSKQFPIFPVSRALRKANDLAFRAANARSHSRGPGGKNLRVALLSLSF